LIIKDGRVIALGYNGPPIKVSHECLENNKCLIADQKIGEGLDKCPAVHAEQNAIANAARNGISIKNSIMYTTTRPCIHCIKIIINAGIKKIFYLKDYKHDSLYDKLIDESGLILEQIKMGDKI